VRSVCFEHAQNKRHGLAFTRACKKARRGNAVATLWDLLERRGRIVGAPRARCKDAVQILHLE